MQLSVFLKQSHLAVAWQTKLWKCLMGSNTRSFWKGEVGAEGSRRRGARADHSRVLQRQKPPRIEPQWGTPCDLWKVNKSRSTAGLHENREQAHSNTLLLRAAEETALSQPAHESTVDFFPWNSVFIISETHPIFSTHFLVYIHGWMLTLGVLHVNSSTVNIMLSQSSKLIIHLLCAGEPLHNGSTADLISTKD